MPKDKRAVANLLALTLPIAQSALPEDVDIMDAILGDAYPELFKPKTEETAQEEDTD
jgi:cobyrinic acid a,c-diamide synthase